ncbi:sensor histidine kinase [Sphingomonas sp. Leaf38]|uniref:sensor histidine kinase n=1 Tax=Sphingomonas sp. Leaf38 TaxID=1736217 RepID=UPI0006F7D91E|nr:ATP-binding protein [Sphingomonas sp. Leaf38]KQN32732.1 hypothetical protein ASE88_01665 [Sphingomonas sp. Leaf38]
MHRLLGIVDQRLDVPERSRGLLAAFAIGGCCIALSTIGSRLAGIDLPFAFALVAVVFGAFWYGALNASVVAMTTIPAAVVLNADHPYVTPTNTVVVALFSIVLILFGGHMTTLRRCADAEARRCGRREVFLQSMFSATPAAMLIADSEGEVVAINASARSILGIDVDDGTYLRLADVLPGPQTDIAGSRLIDRADGRRLTLSVSSVKLFLDTSELQTIYIHDETEAIAAADQLAQLQAELLQLGRATALGQLGSAIAHEVNQPLAAAANYAKVAQVALARGCLEAEVREPLEAALRHIFGAAAVLRRLRDFIRRSPLQPQWVDAHQLIMESTRIGAMAVRRADAELSLFVADDLGEVLIDATQIQQVVLNLLSNAAEAVTGSPIRRVELRATADVPDQCTITVIDTGPGIAPGFEDDVFVPFRTTKVDGLGVGLSISRTIVTAHHGTIAGETNAEGGATFWFTLPRRAAPERMANAA